MASKGSPYNPHATPKYIQDFGKALSGEVRILLQEVGKLRDERRQLQFEIAELMALKSKHGAGGEYSPDWRPRLEGPPPGMLPMPMPEEMPPPPQAIEDIPQARPGWRVVPKKVERRKKITAPPPSAPSPAPPQPMYEPPPNVPAWAQWRPNPLLAPTPLNQPHIPITPPPRAGLFGASTPPPGGR